MDPFLVDTVAGALGGAAGAVAGSPLDVARIRLQQPHATPTPTATLIAAISRREGPQALFRGLSYPLVTGTLQNALVFQSYGATCRALGYTAPSEQPSLAANALAGAVSGSVQCLVTIPQELLKIRMQMQTVRPGHRGYIGAVGMTLRVLNEGRGPAGLFRGTGLTLLRDAPSFAVYFVAYDALFAALTARRVNDAAAEFVAGGAAGVAAWSSVYPVDVVKSRLQAARGGSGSVSAAAVLAGMWREGASAFVRGMAPTLMRAFAVNAAIFSAVGAVKRALPNAENDLRSVPAC